jgi:hypothetical protein
MRTISPPFTAPLARSLPAAELVARLEAETLEAIDRLAGLAR